MHALFWLLGILSNTCLKLKKKNETEHYANPGWKHWHLHLAHVLYTELELSSCGEDFGVSEPFHPQQNFISPGQRFEDYPFLHLWCGKKMLFYQVCMNTAYVTLPIHIQGRWYAARRQTLLNVYSQIANRLLNKGTYFLLPMKYLSLVQKLSHMYTASCRNMLWNEF